MFSHVFCRMKQLQDWENKPGHRTGMASSGAIGSSSWALAWLGDHRLIGGVFMSTIGWNGTNCVLTSETGERNVQYLSKGNAVSKEESLGFAYDYFFIGKEGAFHHQNSPASQCLFQLLVLQTMGRSQGLASVVEHGNEKSVVNGHLNAKSSANGWIQLPCWLPEGKTVKRD